MFPQQGTTSRYHDGLTGLPLLHVDHGLMDVTCPLSPNSQFMYEPDAPECSAFRMTSSSSLCTSATNSESVISPSVEGMTFDEFTLSTNGGSGTDGWFENEKDMFDLVKMEDAFVGSADLGTDPTLTQLNSEDLESTLLDDFDGLCPSALPLLESTYMKMKPFLGCCGSSVTNILPVKPQLQMFPASSMKTTSSSASKYTTCTVTSTTSSPPLASSLSVVPVVAADAAAGNTYCKTHGYPTTSLLQRLVKVEPEIPVLISPTATATRGSTVTVGVTSYIASVPLPHAAILPINPGFQQNVMTGSSGVVMSEVTKPGLIMVDRPAAAGIPETGRGIDQKWKEIENFLHSCERGQVLPSSTPDSERPAKKIKLEKPGKCNPLLQLAIYIYIYNIN